MLTTKECVVMRLGVLLSPAIKGIGHWNASRWWPPPHLPDSMGWVGSCPLDSEAEHGVC